jgi:glyoxylase-like metal-dependent hydrolase (beta-lactamase superfamily II)
MRTIQLAALIGVLAFSATAYAQDDGQPVNREQYASREIAPDPSLAPCNQPQHSITQLKGNLYRWVGGPGGGYTGLLLATKEGVLVIDAGGTCNASWLNDEIKTRFKAPLKYVILSHPHFDHIGGTQVFQEAGATAIAHKNALEPIVGDKLPAAVPDRIFGSKMTLSLGGESVELYHVAPSHSNALTLVYFPAYKALQCVDVCEAGRALPFNDLPDFYYDGFIETLDWVIKLNPEIINTGHGMGTTEDQQVARAYMTNLHDQVLALIRKGEEWDHLYRDVKFTDEEKKYPNYDANHILNIMGMYRYVSEHHRGVW